METKDIEIDWQGNKAKVKIKRLTFGERNALIDGFMKLKMVGNQMVTEISYKDMVEMSMQSCIIEAPFKIDMDTIRGLDPKTGDDIYKEIEALNNLTETKKSS